MLSKKATFKSGQIRRSAISKNEKRRIKTRKGIVRKPHRTKNEEWLRTAIAEYTALLGRKIEPESARRAVKNQALKQLVNTLQINEFRKRKVFSLISALNLVEEIVNGQTQQPELAKSVLRELQRIAEEQNVEDKQTVIRNINNLNAQLGTLDIDAYRAGRQSEYATIWNILKTAISHHGKEILTQELARLLPEGNEFKYLLVHQKALSRILSSQREF